MNHLPIVLFDLGEVLVHLRFSRGMARLLDLTGADPAQADRYAAIFMDPFVLDWNAGLWAPAAFLAELCQRLGPKPVAMHAAAEAWCDVFDPYPEMEQLAAEVVDAGHPTWLLSNTDPLHFSRLASAIPVLSRFTGLHLSYEIGAAKPSPKFFELFLQRTGHAPGDCVFLDDRPEFVATAQALGIRAAVHRGDVAESRLWLQQQGVALR
jgi:FMN phosphatase YigB (HAD superfamily)